MIKLQNLSFIRDDKYILNNISLNINAEKIVGIIGQSGSGKTTLLRCLTQVETHYQGSIIINNINLHNINRAVRANLIGFVFQDYCLFSNLTVFENCLNPLIVVKKLDIIKAENLVNLILKDLGIDNLKNKYPNQLSGGQQQRVALVRALCMEPKVLLLDEPTSAIDHENIIKIQDLLCYMQKKYGITIIIVSHDLSFLKAITNDIYCLEDGKLNHLI